jgi:hypothetical protein
MSEVTNLAYHILPALTTAAGAILGSAITRLSSLRNEQRNELRRKLVDALGDVAALHQLEEHYCQALASAEGSPDSWKRKIRKLHFEAGGLPPSNNATARKALNRRERLIMKNRFSER